MNTKKTAGIIKKPIFNQHNWEEKLGEIILNKKGQELLNRNSVFAIGFTQPYIDEKKIELIEISLTDDDTYFEALKRERENKDKKSSNRFCRHCGKELIERDVPAENYNMLITALGRCPIHSFLKNKAFDDETGKKLFVKEYACPKHGQFFGSKHDRYSIGEPFTK